MTQDRNKNETTGETKPRVYVFDAYGTLFDVHAAIARHRAAAGPDAERFSEIWRTKQLEYSWTLTLAGRYVDFWTLTERALDYAFARVPSVDRALRPKLLDAYLQARCVCRRARGAHEPQGARPRHRHPVQRLAAHARCCRRGVRAWRRCSMRCFRSMPCASTSRGRKSMRSSPAVSPSSPPRSCLYRRTAGT